MSETEERTPEEEAQYQRGIGEGLRQAATFVKGWCRCLDYYKAQGVQDPLCVACELAAELAGRAEEVEAPNGS